MSDLPVTIMAMVKTAGLCASGKARYRDKVAAMLVLATVRRRDGSHRPKLEARAYRCPQCRGWHLTSKRR